MIEGQGEAVVTSIPAFVAKQRELLELELQAEDESSVNNDKKKQGGGAGAARGKTAEEESPGRVHILGRLEATDISVGLYGRTVVQLSLVSASSSSSSTSSSSSDDSNDDSVGQTKRGSKSSPSDSFLLPSHKFTVGDEVEIRGKGASASGGGRGGGNSAAASSTVGGVINAVTDTYISVALFQGGRHQRNTNNSNSSNSNQSNKSKKKQQNNSNNYTEDGDEQRTNDLLQQVPLTLVPKSSVEVHRKMVAALQTLENHGVDHPVTGDVIRAMFFPPSSLSEMTTKTTTTITPPQNRHEGNNNNDDDDQQQRPPPFNPNLDHTQLDAIDFALNRDQKIALIHGPPGTGKTTTIAELITQAVHYHGMRVLVTAPSNVAVDNILERLAENNAAAATGSSNGRKSNAPSKSTSKYKPLKMVRLGHPARIKSSVVSKFSLEALVQSADGTEIVHDVRNELQSFLKLLANPKSKSQDKRIAYRELKTLRKEIRTREEKVVEELISSANVVLATTVGASNRVLNGRRFGSEAAPADFDLVIIDEAAQALEASCWIPILRGKKVVLAGDHLQLPPTIKSKDRRAVSGLGQTMFERLQKLYKPKSGTSTKHPISRMLKIQYRMHHLISDWASETMYGGELMTHESVRHRTLAGLPSVQTETKEEERINDDSLASTTLLLVDTAGCDMHEQATPAGSRFNEGEASIASQHIRALLDIGLRQEDIAVISPYNGQCDLLRSLLLPDFPKLEIRSVDGFQGGEKEAVVFSLVRSSDRGLNGIGFLSDDRRTNVAITRARRHLCCICDTETVTKSPFIKTLVNWMENHGDQRSAIEYTTQSTRNDKDYENDLKAAEDLLKMVEATIPSSSSSAPRVVAAKNGPKKKTDTTKYDQALEDSKRKALMDKISVFAESAKNGDELVLSSELTSYDRRLVHEFAEQIGIQHRSEGVDGVDRRIILTAKRIVEEEPKEEIEPSEDKVKGGAIEEEEINPAPVSNFGALALDESDDESDESSHQKSADQEGKQNADSAPPGNALLSQLAKERAARQETSIKKPSGSSSKVAVTGARKKKKGKGQRLGGQSSKPDAPDDGLDDLDDLAFLDAQIEKNQTSHGRTVHGKGKQYRTVINGILNARPEPQQKQTNKKANSSLQAKLRDAQASRKAKPKKKKK